MQCVARCLKSVPANLFTATVKVVTDEMQAVNHLLREVIFISTVRDLCDNSSFDLVRILSFQKEGLLKNYEDSIKKVLELG